MITLSTLCFCLRYTYRKVLRITMYLHLYYIPKGREGKQKTSTEAKNNNAD